jgi:hypothetical protein
MDRRVLAMQIKRIKDEAARLEAWEKQNPLPAATHFIEGADFIAQIAQALATELRFDNAE